MGTGALTAYLDVAQLVLYLFWIFFAGLIYYLVREGHREGYPMETEGGRGTIGGWPVPDPKTYLLPHGGEATVPDPAKREPPLPAQPVHAYVGAGLVPMGSGLGEGVGPGAWANRADVPDLTAHGTPKIVPLRVLPAYGVSAHDSDPRGLPVIGADGATAGTVRDLWMDQSEFMFRYLEVELAGGQRTVLLPVTFSRIKRDHVKVHAILAHQFAGVPGLRSPDQITLLEEEKVTAYYGGGLLYATPDRAEALV
jgi:photosynthetic reaction center H subunit